MKKIFLVNILPLIIFIILSGVNVNACWCRNDPEETNTEENFRETIAQRVNRSDFVFSGTLIDENNEQLIFKIEDSWKGDIKDTITFRFLHNVSKDGEREYFIDSCAYRFERGKSYLIYANVSLAGLEVSKCGRTDFLTKAQRDIEELNRKRQFSTENRESLKTLENSRKTEKL